MPLNVTLSFPSSTTSEPLPGLVVHRYQIHDALSELFEVAIQVSSTDPAADLHAIVGEAIHIGFDDEPFFTKVVGIVRAVRQLSSVFSADASLSASGYELLVVPPLWLTTRRRAHRIFQNQTVPEVVAAVLAGYHARIPAPRLQLANPHPRREYCVQYGETDYDFISRILADEHVASYFDHTSSSAWTLVDDTSTFTPTLPTPISFHPPTRQTATAPHLMNVVIASHVETSAVTVRDYDFENPRVARSQPSGLEGRGQTNPPTDLFTNEMDLDAYSFAVGRFKTKPQGDALAVQTLDAIRGLARAFTCEASFSLGAGVRMTILDHPRIEVNAELLVVRSRTMVDDGGARADPVTTVTHVLECKHNAQPFLPRKRPKPRIHGTQTAFVVGDPSEGNVDLDSFGRVKVEFVWDRRDLRTGNPTRFVRVSQGWAGAGFGFVTLPRIGEEVIVTYLDGDPDEPLITGRVHNAVTRTPLDLPDKDKTLAVWRSRSFGGGNGYNQVLMDDAAGAERLELHAERNFLSETGKNSTTTVGADASTTVGGSSMNRVTKGYTLQAGSTTISTGACKLAASTLDANANTTMNLSARSVLIDGSDEIKLVSGGSSIMITPGGITINGGKITISGGSITVNAEGTVDVDGALITLN